MLFHFRVCTGECFYDFTELRIRIDVRVRMRRRVCMYECAWEGSVFSLIARLCLLVLTVLAPEIVTR